MYFSFTTLTSGSSGQVRWCLSFTPGVLLDHFYMLFFCFSGWILAASSSQNCTDWMWRVFSPVCRYTFVKKSGRKVLKDESQVWVWNKASVFSSCCRLHFPFDFLCMPWQRLKPKDDDVSWEITSSSRKQMIAERFAFKVGTSHLRATSWFLSRLKFRVRPLEKRTTIHSKKKKKNLLHWWWAVN